MKILLVCAGGFSTTMMMESMKKVVKESKSLDEKDYPVSTNWNAISMTMMSS